MCDNLKTPLRMEDIEAIINAKRIDASEYCILTAENITETIVLTNNRTLKRLLIYEYNAKEISDWTFNEEYQSHIKGSKQTITGNSTLIDKGYEMKGLQH